VLKTKGRINTWSQTAFAHEHAALILDLAGEAIITIDDGDVIRSWNRAAETLFGYTAAEVVGRPLAVLLPPERLAAGELAMLRRLVRERGVVHGFETERVAKDGRIVKASTTWSELVDADGRSIGCCCVIRDVGAQLVLVHQLYESEKLAALRAMAAGFAHEIGNPLAGVLALLQLVERRTHESETRERLIEARGGILRLGRIIRELSDFTRGDGGTTPIDLNEVLRAAVALAKYAHREAPVAVSIDTDPRVRPLLGGRNRLLQACLHIVMNAYDAMSDTGGRLDVRSVQGENEVVLRFEDSGRGMAPEVVARIFDPFFTTKPAGSGTGLGLFVCQRIVAEEFRGRIDVETGPGRGACFIVTLPVRARTVPDGSSQSPADAS